MPVQDTLEMAMAVPEALARLHEDSTYRSCFELAFPRRPISEATVAQALGTYVRSLLAGNSVFDRFRAGSPAALTVSAARGRQLFFGRARCSTCHEGANFTDERFEALGVTRTIPAASPPRGTRGMPETSRFRRCATWR